MNFRTMNFSTQRNNSGLLPGGIVWHDAEQVDEEPVAADVLHPHAPVPAPQSVIQKMFMFMFSFVIFKNSSFLGIL